MSETADAKHWWIPILTTLVVTIGGIAVAFIHIRKSPSPPPTPVTTPSPATPVMTTTLPSPLSSLPLPDPTLVLTVYNAEVSCQQPRTAKCGLSLAQDPHAPYTAATTVTKVWHGDQLIVDCYVEDGQPISAEDGSRIGGIPAVATLAWSPRRMILRVVEGVIKPQTKCKFMRCESRRQAVWMKPHARHAMVAVQVG